MALSNQNIEKDRVTASNQKVQDLSNVGIAGNIGEADVYQLQPLVDPRWNQFLYRHPRASVFHTVEWLKALQQTYGYEPVVYTTSPPNADLKNGLAVCRVDSWLTGHRLVSLPFSDHCEPLIDGDSEQNDIIHGLEQELRRRKLLYLEIRPTHGLQKWNTTLFQSTYAYTFHEIDLKPDLDTLFHNCHKDSTQRKIRRAQREGLVYEEGRSERFLDIFYRLLLMTRRRHQIPPQPKKWFESLIQCFGQALKIRLAFKDDQPVAAILTLRYKDTLVYKYGCSDAKFNNLGGMHLLFWTSIEEAKREGARVFDLGRSQSENSGLITFKDRWGSTRSELFYSRFSRSIHSKDNYRSDRNETAFGLARRMFSYLPDGIQYSLGSLLYRHIG